MALYRSPLTNVVAFIVFEEVSDPSMIPPAHKAYQTDKPFLGCNADVDRIDETDISTAVAVDQRTANCIDEAVRSITAMRSRWRSLRADVTFHRPLSVFRFFRCSSVHCFQTRIISNCSAAHDPYCAIGKSSFSKGDNFPLFKLQAGSHKETPITYGYTQDPFKIDHKNFKTKIKENYPQYLERENKNCFICGDSSPSLRKRL
ncbi:uncharacterized protein TNCV_515681 [Trichonephila clavipes]|nr:uncharacterized protein TNCV_515681 [Trichonephila clavipes]